MVETLISSLKPIGNIVLICCAFFIIFGILGVQVRGAQAGQAVGWAPWSEKRLLTPAQLSQPCANLGAQPVMPLPTVSAQSREGDRCGRNG